MKTLILSVFVLCDGILFAQNVPVSAYYRNDGTYVQSHYRTNPDYTVNNNFTTRGNVNPYTGEYGTLPRESEAVKSLAYYRPEPIQLPSPANNIPLPIFKPLPVDRSASSRVTEINTQLQPERITNYIPLNEEKILTDKSYTTQIGQPKQAFEEFSDKKPSEYIPPINQSANSSISDGTGESILIGFLGVLGIFLFFAKKRF